MLFYFCDCNLYRSFYQRASGPAVHRETWNKDWRRKDERKTYRFRAEPFYGIPDGGGGQHAEEILGAEAPAAGQGIYPGG